MTIILALHGPIKHIKMDYHLVLEKVVVGHLITHVIPSYLQVTDIHTKPLAADLFQQFWSKLGVQNNLTPKLEGA